MFVRETDCDELELPHWEAVLLVGSLDVERLSEFVFGLS